MVVSQASDRPGRRSHREAILALLVVLLLTSALAPRVVEAHAELAHTSPEDGAELETAPEHVTLTFTEAVQPVAESMTLFDSQGATGTLDATAASGTSISLALPPDLADGTYVVGWRVISADAHPISGTVTFSIGEASPAPVTAEAQPADDITPLLGIVQGLAYATLVATVGLVWFGAFVLGAVPRRRLVLATSLAAVAVGAHLLLIPLTTMREVGESIGALFDPGMWNDGGRLFAALGLVAVGLLLQLGGAARLGRAPISRWVVALGGLIALGSLPVVGHTVTKGPAWLMSPSDIVHGVAAASWFGGLLGLALYLVAALRQKAADGQPIPVECARVITRFSWLAGWTVAAVALSGVVMAVRILGSFDALVHTAFGKVLIAKVLVVLMVLLIAAWNRRRLVPAIAHAPDAPAGWRRLRATVLAETLLLVAVLALTGFLVLQNPNLAETQASSAPATVPYEHTAPLGEGSLQVRIDAGVVGDNEFSLVVLDGDEQPVELVDDPTVRFSLPEAGLGPIESIATPTGEPGQYAGEIRIPLDGTWKLDVVTRLSRYEAPITTVEVPIPNTAAATPAP